MSEATFCFECEHVNDWICSDEDRRAWVCPGFKRKKSAEERYILRIADRFSDSKCIKCEKCPAYVDCKSDYNDNSHICAEHLYNWMMGFKGEIL